MKIQTPLKEEFLLKCTSLSNSLRRTSAQRFTTWMAPCSFSYCLLLDNPLVTRGREGWMDDWMAGRRNGWWEGGMDGRMDGWMDGGKEEWMDGGMNR